MSSPAIKLLASSAYVAGQHLGASKADFRDAALRIVLR